MLASERMKDMPKPKPPAVFWRLKMWYNGTTDVMLAAQQKTGSSVTQTTSPSLVFGGVEHATVLPSLGPLYAVPTRILFFLTRIPTWLFFKTFKGLTIEGVENIANLPRGVIFAANHSSELDPILMTLIFPIFSKHLPLFFTARGRSFYTASGWRQMIYGGFFFKMWGAYEVYPGKKNYEESLRNHIALLNDKRSVCIFPEGKRTPDGKVHEAKGGVTYLSYRTGSPIVPVAINRRNYKIKIGEALYPKDIFQNPNVVTVNETRDDCKRAAAVVMERINLML
jgi:1-acyl-sn-glycerol-3-phosphate acyltransferase